MPIGISKISAYGQSNYFSVKAKVSLHSGKYVTFEEGYSCLQEQIRVEQLGNLHQFIKNGASLEEVLELVG